MVIDAPISEGFLIDEIYRYLMKLMTLKYFIISIWNFYPLNPVFIINEDPACLYFSN